MEKQKIFITGISGFVGLNLNPYLRDDFEVVGISRKKNQNCISYEMFFEGDAKYDALVHLAGKAHDLKKTANVNEYYEVNFQLTKKLYDCFLISNAKKFIYISSVKAVADSVDGVLDEDEIPNPLTAYGKSKLMAEQYIMENLPNDKEVYILRPCMIHGPANKGNLNLLYNMVSKGIPYPLASYQNQRSFLSISNLCFVIDQLLTIKIPSGIYNIADDEPISTNELLVLMAGVLKQKPRLLKVPKAIIEFTAKVGDILKAPINSENFKKLAENFKVSNQKIKNSLGIQKLPTSTITGLKITIQSFKNK